MRGMSKLRMVLREISTGRFMKPKVESVFSAEERMVMLESWLLITTTKQDMSEDFCVPKETKYSHILEMILRRHSESINI